MDGGDVCEGVVLVSESSDRVKKGSRIPVKLICNTLPRISNPSPIQPTNHTTIDNNSIFIFKLFNPKTWLQIVKQTPIRTPGYWLPQYLCTTSTARLVGCYSSKLGMPPTCAYQKFGLVHPQIMKNHTQDMTMAHVLQQGLWGEGILHSEHLWPFILKRHPPWKVDFHAKNAFFVTKCLKPSFKPIIFFLPIDRAVEDRKR